MYEGSYTRFPKLKDKTYRRVYTVHASRMKKKRKKKNIPRNTCTQCTRISTAQLAGAVAAAAAAAGGAAAAAAGAGAGAATGLAAAAGARTAIAGASARTAAAGAGTAGCWHSWWWSGGLGVGWCGQNGSGDHAKWVVARLPCHPDPA